MNTDDKLSSIRDAADKLDAIIDDIDHDDLEYPWLCDSLTALDGAYFAIAGEHLY